MFMENWVSGRVTVSQHYYQQFLKKIQKKKDTAARKYIPSFVRPMVTYANQNLIDVLHRMFRVVEILCDKRPHCLMEGVGLLAIMCEPYVLWCQIQNIVIHCAYMFNTIIHNTLFSLCKAAGTVCCFYGVAII